MVVKSFAPAHVIIFSNHPPRLDQLSMDRWNVIEGDLSDDRTLHDFFPPHKFPGVAALSDPFETFLDPDERGIHSCPSPRGSGVRRELGSPPHDASPAHRQAGSSLGERHHVPVFLSEACD